MSTEENVQEINDDEPMFIAPDAKEPPPVLPSGWHRGKLLHMKQNSRDGNEGPIRFFDIAVVVQHPELGRCVIGTSPFGPQGVNTALQGRTGSKAEDYAKVLGVVGESNAQMKRFEEADIEVKVATRQGKDTKSGKMRTYADIVDLRWPGGGDE